jgi:uncharacterized SAM-binding protein YcdF (DUF218 family)
MRKRLRLLKLISALAIAALALGFVAFAFAVSRAEVDDVPAADGMVVLTGIEQRIRQAGELMKRAKAKRLLISGANPITSRDELRRQSGLDKTEFDCCVDVGYEAQDTIGNAEETRAWAEAHKFHSLIVVTSSYHMPRSLAELGRALPEATLIPFPVAPKPWHPASVAALARRSRTLLAEYVKFLPSAARFGIARLIRTIDTWVGSPPAQRLH